MGINARRLAALAAVLAMGAAPGVAIAASGDDQYCDPFGGCGGPTTTTTTGKGGGSNGGGGKPGADAPARELTPAESHAIAQLADSTDAARVAQLRRAAAVDPAAIERFQKALKARQARAVLDAAGLSALRQTIPID